MELDYLVPSPRSAAAISIVGQVSGIGALVQDTVPALLPNLHIRVAGASRYRFGSGRWQVAPPVALIGATNAAFGIEMSADFEMVCVGLLPDGWRACVGLPGAQFADAMLDAASVWPASAVSELLDAVCAARGLAARRGVVEAFLHRSARVPACERRVQAIGRWLEGPGTLSLEALAGQVDLSPRQIARLTLDAYGSSPKTLAMKYRALRAAGALTVHGKAGLPDALERYADQSHLIRDFHRFVGWTPGRFLADRQPLARTTMLGRWNAGVRSTMALCS